MGFQRVETDMVDGIPNRQNPRRPRHLWESVRRVSPCPGGLVQGTNGSELFARLKRFGVNRQVEPLQELTNELRLGPHRRSMVTSPWGSSHPMTSFPPPREAGERAGLGMGLRLWQGLEKQATLLFVKEYKYVSPYIYL